MQEFHIQLKDEVAQQQFGGALAGVLVPPVRLYLQGDLGAGKTTLVRGMLRALGYRGAVRSPTYTLVEPYKLDDATFYHLDLYRLADGEELEYLGLRDILAERAWLVIEWPEQAGDWLPAADLLIELRHADVGRELKLCGISATGKGIINKLQQQFP